MINSIRSFRYINHLIQICQMTPELYLYVNGSDLDRIGHDLYPDIVNHRENIPENTLGRDMRHMDVSDASRESSSFARTPLSVMTNQKCNTL